MATIIAQARKLSAFFSWCEDFAKSIICEVSHSNNRCSGVMEQL
jgi:hypothetical protein